MNMEDSRKDPIEVPYQSLDPQVLRSLVESFVLREGTDYGLHEVGHETKIEQILKQIRQSEIKIFFDPETESVNLVSRHQMK